MNHTPSTQDDFPNSHHDTESDALFSDELHRMARSIEPKADFARRLISDLEVRRASLQPAQAQHHPSGIKSQKEKTTVSSNTQIYASFKPGLPVKAGARGFMVFAAALVVVVVAALFLLTYPPTSSGVSGSLFLQASATPADAAAQLNAFFSDLTARDMFSGAVLLTRDQTVLLREGYGLADREWNIPNTPTTKFRIASITKEFTGAAIMLLQEEGKLTVQDKVWQYLLNCPVDWRSITLHELLTHTSGIRDYDTMEGYDAFKRQPATENDIVNFFRKEPLRFAPGSHFDYSNSGYILPGQVIQRVSGESYQNFLQNHFFTPLGLTDTGIEDMTTILPNRARGYQSPTELAPYIDMTTEDAAGQIYTTVDDLNRWNQALVSGKVVSQKTFDTMIGAAVPVPANGLPIKGYGYGIVTGDYQGHSIYLQSGDVSGFVSCIYYFPEDKTTLVIMSNLLSNQMSEDDMLQFFVKPLSILYGSPSEG